MSTVGVDCDARDDYTLWDCGPAYDTKRGDQHYVSLDWQASFDSVVRGSLIDSGR